MILIDQYWYNVMPSQDETEGSFESITGKWLCFGDKSFMHSLLPSLNDLVEKGEIRAAKISRKIPKYDLFPDKACVMCVFTSKDQSEKDRIKKLLKGRFGLETTIWKSEEQTLEDWKENGWLRIQAQIGELRTGIQSGQVVEKEAAYNKIIELTERLEEVFCGVHDPNRKLEIYLNRVQELRHSIEDESRKDQKKPKTLDVLSHLTEIEDVLNRVLSLVERDNTSLHGSLSIDPYMFKTIEPHTKDGIYHKLDLLTKKATRIEKLSLTTLKTSQDLLNRLSYETATKKDVLSARKIIIQNQQQFQEEMRISLTAIKGSLQPILQGQIGKVRTKKLWKILEGIDTIGGNVEFAKQIVELFKFLVQNNILQFVLPYLVLLLTK